MVLGSIANPIKIILYVFNRAFRPSTTKKEWEMTFDLVQRMDRIRWLIEDKAIVSRLEYLLHKFCQVLH